MDFSSQSTSWNGILLLTMSLYVNFSGLILMCCIEYLLSYYRNAFLITTPIVCIYLVICLCVSMYYRRIQCNIPRIFYFKKGIFPQKKFTSEKYISAVIKIRPHFKTCLSKMKFIISEQIHILTSLMISRTKNSP